MVVLTHLYNGIPELGDGFKYSHFMTNGGLLEVCWLKCEGPVEPLGHYVITTIRRIYGPSGVSLLEEETSSESNYPLS